MADDLQTVGPGQEGSRGVGPADVVAQKAPVSRVLTGDQRVGQSDDDDGVEPQAPGPRVRGHEDPVPEAAFGALGGVQHGRFELRAHGASKRRQIGAARDAIEVAQGRHHSPYLAGRRRLRPGPPAPVGGGEVMVEKADGPRAEGLP